MGTLNQSTSLELAMEMADRIDESSASIRVVADALEVVDSILEQLPICVTVGDANGWLYVSRRFSDVLGYDRDTLSEMRLDRVIHPGDLDAWRSMTEMVRTGQLPWGDVVNRFRVHGTQRYLRLHWRWGPPKGPRHVTVAVAEVVGPAGAVG